MLKSAVLWQFAKYFDFQKILIESKGILGISIGMVNFGYPEPSFLYKYLILFAYDVFCL